MRQDMLTEPRAVRVLSRGGMARREAGRWMVYRTRDARLRPVGPVLGLVIERLVKAGRLSGRTPDRLVWQGPRPDVRVPPPPVGVVDLSVRRTARRQKRPLLERVLSEAGSRDAEIRLAAAAGRYRADTEQAAAPQPVTMRWDGLGTAIEGGRRGGGFTPGGRSLAASARLRQVEEALGAGQVRILDEVLVRGASAAGLARLLGVAPNVAVRETLEALLALAKAYDLNVRSQGA